MTKKNIYIRKASENVSDSLYIFIAQLFFCFVSFSCAAIKIESEYIKFHSQVERKEKNYFHSIWNRNVKNVREENFNWQKTQRGRDVTLDYSNVLMYTQCDMDETCNLHKSLLSRERKTQSWWTRTERNWSLISTCRLEFKITHQWERELRTS